MRRIYLDNNATTALSTEVIAAVCNVWSKPLNASSVHGFGCDARKIIENARDKIRKYTGAKEMRVIFTSSGTEANNLALKGVKYDNLVVSSIEHASILKTAQGAHLIDVDENGVVKPEHLDEILSSLTGRTLVSVMLANNETGAIQPIAKISEIAKKYNAILHSDMVQAVGKIKVDITKLGVDLATISAHKIYGPQGAGVLIAAKNITIESQIIGGGQEGSYRAGTENIVAIHGFGVAIQEAHKNLCKIKDTENLRDRLENFIQSLDADIEIFSKNVERLPNTSCFTMPGVVNETQLIHFDMDQIAVSAGAACSSGKIDESHVLKAMHVPGDVATTVIRVSLGKNNKLDDIGRFITSWKSLYERTRQRQAA